MTKPNLNTPRGYGHHGHGSGSSNISTPLTISAVILIVYFLGCFSGVLFAEIPRVIAKVVVAPPPQYQASFMYGANNNPAPPQTQQQQSTTTALRFTAPTTTTTAIRALNNNNPAIDYQTAYDESFGFFDDIPTRDWELMRKITMARSLPKNPKHHMAKSNKWYQYNWDPDFSCRHDTKVGQGDGTKWVCDPLRIVDQSKRRMEENKQQGQDTSAGCIVYSVGSNGNFEFERGVADMLPGACEIHTFDFEPKYGEQVPEGNEWNIHYHAWGFKPSYSETKNTRDGKYGQADPNLGEFKTFEETKKLLGHEGRPIDIFKIDCEGCEWTTYKDWLKADIRQALVEVHRSPEVAVDFFQDLQKEGYVIFHKEPNIASTDGNCLEYGFLKLDKSYVQNRIESAKLRKKIGRHS